MRIGIDARSIHLEGVGRYIHELITNIADMDNENEYVIYFLSDNQRRLHEVKKENFSSMILPVSLYAIHKQPLLSYQLRKDRLDLFHATDHWLAPFVPPCNMVITIHDLFMHFIPELSTRKALLYGKIVFPWTFKQSKRLILTSNFLKEQLLKYYPATAYKLSVIPLGVSERFKVVRYDDIDRVRNRYNLKKKYILYVGNLRNHKNLGRLLEAFSKLPTEIKDVYNLVIAADKKERYAEILKKPKELGIEKTVQFIGFVQTDDLTAIYQSASVFVLPSLCEWFGLPIVEAMACGIPVITSNITAMPEVAGDAAFLVNPYDTHDLRNAMEQVLSNEELRVKLIARGRTRAQRFSWSEVTSKVLNIYKELHKKR